MSSLFINTLITTALLLGTTFFYLKKINNSIYTQRWYSWLAITVLFTSSYLLGNEAFRYAVVFLALIMIGEFSKLIQLSNALTALLLVLHLQFFIEIGFGYSPTLVGPWVVPLLFLITLTSPVLSKGTDQAFAFYLLVLISVSFPLLALQPDKSLALLLTVGVYDVASFIGGKSLSRNKFLNYRIFPKASPNKTLAGLLVGSIAAGLILLTLGRFTLVGWALIILLAPLGDYLESRVKRAVGVKDAGNWLPGFGGALDRFDSLLPLAGLAVLIF